MKSFLRVSPTAIIVAILALIMQVLDMQSGGLFLAWVGFAAWACYFIAGSTIGGGVKALRCWCAGFLAAIIIIQLGTLLSGYIPAGIAFPVVVAVVAYFVMLFDKVPALDCIPVWFVGAACFFAISNGANLEAIGGAGDYYVNIITVMIISAVVGQIFGFLTVVLGTLLGLRMLIKS